MDDLLAKTKAQAEVLIPLLKALRAEIGQVRADKLVVDALSGWAASLGREIRDGFEGAPLQKLRQAIESCDESGLQQNEFLVETADRLDYNITSCRVADFYRSLGLGDMGFLLVCRLDDSVMPALDPRIEMTRERTIMQGASHCEFRMQLGKSTA